MKFQRENPQVEPSQETNPDIEHFAMPAENIHPHPASEHSFRLLALILGAIAVASAVAVIIVSITTTDTSNNLRSFVNKSDAKSVIRDHQHTQTENQIKLLTDQLRATQTRDNAAICTLIIGLIQQGKAANPGMPVDTTIIGPFLRRYGCQIPAWLLG
jgi:hypothetical protein